MIKLKKSDHLICNQVYVINPEMESKFAKYFVEGCRTQLISSFIVTRINNREGNHEIVYKQGNVISSFTVRPGYGELFSMVTKGFERGQVLGIRSSYQSQFVHERGAREYGKFGAHEFTVIDVVPQTIGFIIVIENFHGQRHAVRVNHEDFKMFRLIRSTSVNASEFVKGKSYMIPPEREKDLKTLLSSHFVTFVGSAFPFKVIEIRPIHSAYAAQGSITILIENHKGETCDFAFNVSDVGLFHTVIERKTLTTKPRVDSLTLTVTNESERLEAIKLLESISYV